MIKALIKKLKRIDGILLPEQKNMRYGPYIWLVYLSIFYTSLWVYHPVKYSFLYAAIATVGFLVAYFNGYWVSKRRIKLNIISILVIGSLSSLLTPGASVFFVYAGAFCCRLGNSRNAFIGLLLITLWVIFLSWFFSYSPYFYVPAIAFTWMVGGVNIYQHDIELKRQELNLSQQEVRRLARTSERERIARDLHDLIGHTFSVITLKAELAGKLIDKDQLKAKQEIEQLEIISRDALAQIREVVTGYRTSDLKSELAHAKYVLQSNDITFSYQYTEFELSERINKELAIILKELVTNVLKHANADTVEFVLEQQNESINFTLTDNGDGLGEQDSKGYGLIGIKERVAKMSGTVSFGSHGKNNRGLNTHIQIPMETQQ